MITITFVEEGTFVINFFIFKKSNPGLLFINSKNITSRYSRALPGILDAKDHIIEKRSPSIGQYGRDGLPHHLGNGWTSRYYKTRTELHPGCDEFWFLPGI